MQSAFLPVVFGTGMGISRLADFLERMNMAADKSVVTCAAIEAYPSEACGVIIALQNGKQETIPCRNIASDPENFFMADHEDVSKARERGEIVAVWHTHVERSNVPSEADKAACEASAIPFLIYSISKGDYFHLSDAYVLHPTGVEADYLGRPYVEGVFDCYSLLRDYYRREFGIHLNDYPRTESGGVKGFTKFIERYESEGFHIVSDGSYKPGDVFFMQVMNDSCPNHIGIYLGDEIMMHHCHNRLSKRDVYGGFWAKHTTHHLRHKQC